MYGTINKLYRSFLCTYLYVFGVNPDAGSVEDAAGGGQDPPGRQEVAGAPHVRLVAVVDDHDGARVTVRVRVEHRVRQHCTFRNTQYND